MKFSQNYEDLKIWEKRKYSSAILVKRDNLYMTNEWIKNFK